MGALEKYNQAVMGVGCPKCGVKPLQRCVPSSGNPVAYQPIPPHAARLKLAKSEVTNE